MTREYLPIAVQVQAGYFIRFDLEHQSIQFFQNERPMNPLRFSNNSNHFVCLMITDLDSCFQIAGMISAVLGLLIGEGIPTKTGIMYEFKSRG